MQSGWAGVSSLDQKKALRVFLGPVEIAGIAEGLSSGLNSLGASANVRLSIPHPFNYGRDTPPWLYRLWRYIGALRNATPRARIVRKLALVAAHTFWSWVILARAALEYDAFIFLYGQTITNSVFELWLLKRLSRKIIFIYVGSDTRPPYMDGMHTLSENDSVSAAQLMRLSLKCKRALKLQERYADYLVNSPSTAHFHERPYINWFSLGIPKLLPVHMPLAKKTDSGRIRILHSPSHPVLKGTASILDTIKRLADKGYSIDLIKIEKMSNEVVLKELASCDFVVDQLYSDTPLAVFATEAAFFGKPAVVGGYFSEQVDRVLNESELPPSLYVAPEQLENAIERLIVDGSFRKELGERAKSFVNERWSSSAVAARYLRLLHDDVPEEWWLFPGGVEYLQGCGLARASVAHRVKVLVEHFGVEALQVTDKPLLEQGLKNLSSSLSANA
ncbi:glycosyltransferase [Aquipseudomonas alcaligenes]